MRARWISKTRMLALALSIVAPLGVLGCDVRDGDNSDFAEFDVTVGQVTTANAAEVLPGGPDAIGGVGDFFLRNGRVELIVDQVAQDPTTANVGALQELAGFSGGTLVDFASEAGGLANDQLDQLAQVMLGNNDAGGIINPIFFPARYTQLEVGVDTADRGTLVATGVFLVLDATTLPEGTVLRADVGTTNLGAGVGIIPQINFGADIDLSDLGGSPVLCSDGDGVGAVTSNQTGDITDLPIIVRTTYSLSRDNTHVDVQTVVINPGPNDRVGVTSVVDLVLSGGDQGNNVKFSPPFGRAALDGVFDEVSAAAGAVLAEANVPLQFITPYMAFTGEDDPAISYALCDQVAGQVIEIRGGGALLGIAAQLADQTGRIGLLATQANLAHSRVFATGQRGDVGSAIDEVNQLLADQIIRQNPADGALLPNSVSALGTLTGTTTPAVEGAIVTIVQDDPGLFFNGDAAIIGSFVVGETSVVNDTDVVFAGFAAFGLNVVHDLSEAVTQADGTFTARLPAGVYTVTVTSSQQGNATVATITVPAGGVATADFALTDVGTASFEVTEGGNPVPAKLTFSGENATADPNFGILERVAGVGKIVYSASGRGTVELPPGDYQVIATRGIEYSAAQSAIFSVVAGAETVIPTLSLTRVVNTTNFVSADYHIHSGRSFDSTVPLRDRVVSFLANGVEVMVATDHDVNTDYGPTIAGLDLELLGLVNADGLINSVVGSELTAFVPFDPFLQTIGHYNAWPLAFQATARRRGAPQDEFRSPGLLFDTIRGTGAAAGLATLVQLNHPHGGINLGRAIGYFDAAQPNAVLGNLNLIFSTPLANADIDDLVNPVANLSGGASTTTNVDFDTIEVFNGSQGGETADPAGGDKIMTEYIASRADWFALMNRGLIRTATGNSDSHFVSDQDGTLSTDMAGFPRTYFRSDAGVEADLSTLNVTAMNTALAQSVNDDGTVTVDAGSINGEAFCSSGPVITVEVDVDQDGNGDGTLGDFVADADNTLDLIITVEAAPWVPVNEIRVIVNGGDTAGVDSGVGVATDGSFSVVRSGTAITQPANDFDDTGAGVTRFQATVTITGVGDNGTDAWIIVEASSFDTGNTPGVINVQSLLDVDGDGLLEGGGNFTTITAPGGVYNQVAPGFVSLGFTNPIFIDRNGDGDFDAPGLP